MFTLLQRLASRPGAAASAEPVRGRDERLRAAFAAAPVGLGVAGFDGRWILFNDAAATLLGYTREELARLGLHDITHPDDRARELDFLRRMAAGEVKRYQLEKRIVDKVGHERAIVVTAALVRGSEAIVYVLEPVENDIVEELKARLQAEIARSGALEQELRELRQRADPEWTPFTDRGPLDVIEETSRAGRTGLLLFANESRQTSVYLEDGCIASCASNDPARSLGERLVRSGAITEAQRTKALEMSEATNVTLGRALVILGALREESVAHALHEKIDRELSDLESWLTGRWTFAPRTPPRVKPVRVVLPLAELRQFARAEYVASRNGTRYHRPSCTSMLRVKGNERLPVVSPLAGAERGLSPCRMCI